MESQLLRITQGNKPEPSALTEKLIREWLFRFAIEHKEDAAPRVPLWIEAFGGMDPEILESLFKKALKTCRFFPKVSEILAPLETVKQAALPEEASEAWQRVLAIRREHYNPDVPQYLSATLALLSERTQRAARAAGVFREFESTDDLHTWAKKRFIESYLAWDKIEENEFLLPDGDLKNLLAEVAVTKALPISARELPKRLPYTPTIAAQRESAREASAPPAAPIRETPQVIDFEGRSAELQRQAKLIREKYPTEAGKISTSA